jgi:hypothetical protein
MSESNRILELEHDLELGLIQCDSLRSISEKYRQELDQLRDYSDTEITEKAKVKLFSLFPPR